MTTRNDLRDQLSVASCLAAEFNLKSQRDGALTGAEMREWKAALDKRDSLRSTLGYTGATDAIESDSIVMGGQRANDPASRALAHYFRTGDDTELRAQGEGTGPAGGYTVPSGFWAKVTEAAKAFGGLRRLAEPIMTDTGNNLPWPTNDDTNNAGAILSENTQDTDQDTSFGQKQLAAYTYTSHIVKVSLQLVQDSGIDIEAFVARKIGQRLGRAQAPHFISGTGSNQPQGLLTGLSVGKTAAAQTAITYNELLDLVASVDPAYLAGAEEDGDPLGTLAGGVAWIMNFNTYTYLGKLRDDIGGAGLGRPLFQPDASGKQVRTIAGYPIVIDQAMPAMTAGAKPLAFGNLRQAYVIRTVAKGEVLRLVERYADYLQVGFLGFERADGLVQDVSAAKAFQMAA